MNLTKKDLEEIKKTADKTKDVHLLFLIEILREIKDIKELLDKRLLTMTSGSRIRYDDEAEIGNGFSKDLIDAFQSAMEVAQTHKLD